jgi:hypothetical protein
MQMPATMLERTGHRGETEYEFDLLKQYFELSELAISEAENSENKRLQEALASVKRGAETYSAAMRSSRNMQESFSESFR